MPGERSRLFTGTIGAKNYKPTNYNRVRSMSIEKMAEFAVISTKFFCSKTNDVCDKPMNCVQCALEWLKQEAPQ